MAKRMPIHKQLERTTDINKMTKKQLTFTITSLARRANRRLGELEKADMKKASNAYRWAERQAFDERRFMKNSKEKPRFRTDISNASVAELREEMSELRTFMFESSTSSVRGVNAKYRESYEEAKNYFGNTMKGISFDEWAFFWSANNTKTLVDEYNSQVIEIIQELELSKLSKEELEEVIQKFIGREVHSSLSSMKDEVADEMIKRGKREPKKTRTLEEENKDGSLTTSLSMIP